MIVRSSTNKKEIIIEYQHLINGGGVMPHKFTKY